MMLVESGGSQNLLHVLDCGGKHAALHCRHGIGRSALIAAFLLAEQGLGVDEAFGQLATVRRQPVPDTDEQRAWVSTFRRQRDRPR